MRLDIWSMTTYVYKLRFAELAYILIRCIDFHWGDTSFQQSFAEVSHGIPNGEPAHGDDREENKEYVGIVDAHGIGVDDEGALALAQ